ncbi:glycosyl transferase family 1 [Desulfonema ishimotonii]|uniref:Glycosyl transferase family 1 n=1 Tax=Desulfonema ishimotonii TaxID=45657 RepID=A0A401FVD2_9BACT|nr:glycosyl transferase family 1 [Desulfonema ishimotonii]
MRFLFVSSDKFPPFRVDVAVLFGRKLAERGHRIDWILQSDDPLDRGIRVRWSGGDVRVGPTDNRPTPVCKVLRRIYDIINDLNMFVMMKRRRYDFILIRDKFISALTGLLAAKLFNVPCVYWLSYPFPEDLLYQAEEGLARHPGQFRLRGHILKFLLYHIILPQADHIFVQTEHMQNDIARHGISMEKMTPVPMGVPIREIPFFGYPAAPRDREKIVLYLGTLIRGRKLEFLIRVFEKVLKEEKNARLYLVGGGDDDSDEKRLRDAACRLGIGTSVVVTGFLPQQDAWNFVRHADVCVSPIYPAPVLSCSSPTKLIEYMAMGKAVVANDIPEQRRAIEESGGGICVAWDEKAFAGAILRLIRHPETAREMGSRGRAYVAEKKNYDRIADAVEDRLLTVCNDRGDKKTWPFNPEKNSV